MYEYNDMNEYKDLYEYNEEDGGIQFQPYDDELITEYLIPKLEGKPCGEITVKDVYSKEPWLLDHPVGSFFKKNEWYYFVTRTQVSKKKIGCGQKAKRMITRDNYSGSWKANAKGVIRDKETKMVIGEHQTLAFKSKVNNKKKQKMGEGTSCDVVEPGSESSWIMTEYMLPKIEGKFRELVICKIHEIENSNKKKKDDRHEASTSSCHHQPESSLASSFSDQQLQHPINEPHHQDESALASTSSYHHQPESVLASTFSDQQLQHPINEPHHHQDESALASYFTYQQLQHPINEPHHQDESALASYFSYQQLQHPINEPHQYESALASSFSDHQLQHPINEPHHQHESVLAFSFYDQQLQHQDHEASTYLYHTDSSTSEQQPINTFYHGTSLASYLDQHLMNLYDDLPSFSFEEEPTNVTRKIQENNKKNDHEAFIPHHYDFLADSSAVQQPVNEAHGRVPEIPLIGSENNDQVFEASRQVSEKYEQVYIDAPLEEEGGEWIQEFINKLTTMSTSNMPMEEDVEMIYDTSLIDQDMVNQYATLRPQE